MKKLIGAVLALGVCGAFGASTIDPSNASAYGGNIGWCNWLPGSGGAVIGDYVCSGAVYIGNCGWVSLGNGAPADGLRYANTSATDFGVNHDGMGNLRGLAYAANLGWISFETNGAPRVNLLTGVLSGYIYSANCGWLSLSNTIAHVRTLKLDPGADSDEDGMADAWEIQRFGSSRLADAKSDTDGDGTLDWQEYLADTDPRNPAERLMITDYTPGIAGAPASLTWTSRPTRLYRIQQTDDLLSDVWPDSGLGLISPDGLTTSRSVDGVAAAKFFRVQAVRPLAD